MAAAAAAAARQVHIQAPGRLQALDDVLIPQLSVADQRDRGHTWPKQRSGGSSREEVGLLWMLHVDPTHSLTHDRDGIRRSVCLPPMWVSLCGSKGLQTSVSKVAGNHAMQLCHRL